MLEEMLSRARNEVVIVGNKAARMRSNKEVTVEFKEGGSPRTNADLMVETQLRKELLTAYSDFSFLGEEFPPHKGTSKYRWVLDPIDGTWPFINFENTAAVSLSLEDTEKDKTVLGIVYNPFTYELYTAAEGIPGVWESCPLTDTAIKQLLPLVQKDDLKKTLINVYIYKKNLHKLQAIYNLWEQNGTGKMVIQNGSIAYSLAQVADGRYSVFFGLFFSPLSRWDYSAGAYLVRNGRGLVTGIDGQDYERTSTPKTMIAATNSALHDQAIETARRIGLDKSADGL